MIEHSIRGESPSTAHNRHAKAPQDEEGYIPSSASSSLTRVSSSSIPKIPVHLIAGLILPFVTDRVTWNSVYCASKELCRAGKKITPPWPNKAFFNPSKAFNPNKAFNSLEHAVRKAFNLQLAVRHVAFSPSGSYLAFVQENGTYQTDVHIWDRWGKETLLAGHTTEIYCLEHSLDGEYLASGCQNRSIRIWVTESFHATSSKTSMERSRRTPEEAVTIILASRDVMALSFSRTNSNILASGELYGEIKVWNVQEQECIHSFDPGRGRIRSLYFAGGADSACIAVAGAGSIIRLWKAEGSVDFTSEIIGETAGRGNALRAVISPSGSFLATSAYSGREIASTVALCDLETMTKTQSVFIPGVRATCFALSPDGKQLVIGDHNGRIRLFQDADHFSIHKDLVPRGIASSTTVLSAAFDPTCRVLALACQDGRLDLRTL
jgi:WD40 repeat protein